jgi:hypothetical protein
MDADTGKNLEQEETEKTEFFSPFSPCSLKKLISYVVHFRHVTKMSNGPDSLPANRVSSMISTSPRGVDAPVQKITIRAALGKQFPQKVKSVHCDGSFDGKRWMRPFGRASQALALQLLTMPHRPSYGLTPSMVFR